MRAQIQFAHGVLIGAVLVGTVNLSSAAAQVRTIQRVSQGAGGLESNENSRHPVVSDDGRFIAFESDSTNLIAGDGNSVTDVFLFDTIAGTTVRVSNDSGGGDADGVSGEVDSSQRPIAMSSDGAFVAYSSRATDIDPADQNGSISDIFLWAASTGLNTRASYGENESNPVNQDALAPGLSDDGGLALFTSIGDFVTAGFSNGDFDVFVRGTSGSPPTRLVSHAEGDNFSEGNQATAFSAISRDGLKIAVAGLANNLTSGVDTDGLLDVYLIDRIGDTAALVSVSTEGANADGNCISPALDATGNSVAFVSVSTNLTSHGSGGFDQVFVRDVALGTTELISLGINGQPADQHCSEPSISADGRYVAFVSAASNLVVKDGNNVADLFVRDRVLAKTIRVNLSRTKDEALSPVHQGYLSGSGRFAVFSSTDSEHVSGDTNGKSDIFLVTLDRTITPETGITEPPAVQPGNRENTINVVMENFKKASLKNFVQNSASASARRPKPKLTIEYRINLTNSGSGNTRRAVSKRNTFTFKKVPAGNYSVTYRVIVKKNDRRAFSTNESPAAAISVGS